VSLGKLTTVYNYKLPKTVRNLPFGMLMEYKHVRLNFGSILPNTLMMPSLSPSLLIKPTDPISECLKVKRFSIA